MLIFFFKCLICQRLIFSLKFKNTQGNRRSRNLTLAGISVLKVTRAIPRFNKSFANSRISVRSNEHVHTRKQHCFQQSPARWCTQIYCGRRITNIDEVTWFTTHRVTYHLNTYTCIQKTHTYTRAHSVRGRTKAYELKLRYQPITTAKLT